MGFKLTSLSGDPWQPLGGPPCGQKFWAEILGRACPDFGQSFWAELLGRGGLDLGTDVGEPCGARLGGMIWKSFWGNFGVTKFMATLSAHMDVCP